MFDKMEQKPQSLFFFSITLLRLVIAISAFLRYCLRALEKGTFIVTMDVSELREAVTIFTAGETLRQGHAFGSTIRSKGWKSNILGRAIDKGGNTVTFVQRRCSPRSRKPIEIPFVIIDPH